MLQHTFQFKLYTQNETDCTARSTVTITARQAEEGDATVEMKKR
jgi:hypothetical protein